VATECSWNDGSKAQYYVVILDRLLGRSGGLERAPEWRVRGPLIGNFWDEKFLTERYCHESPRP